MQRERIFSTPAASPAAGSCGLRGLFSGDDEFEVVGEAGDGAETVGPAQRVEVDVILTDLRMPRMGGAV